MVKPETDTKSKIVGGGDNPLPAFYCKVSKSGGSRLISVGRFLAKSWHYVKLEVIEKGKNYCIIRISKID